MNRILEAGHQFQQRVEKATEAIAAINTGAPPDTALILGTGLGALVHEISDPLTLPYRDIPGFPVSTAPGHAGRLHIGQIGSARVLAFEGRFHTYEGWSMADISMPMRVAGRLGVSSAIISNACGGIDPELKKGDLLLLDDHINLLGQNPLTGANVDQWGPRFPDMSQPYCLESVAKMQKIAAQLGIRASQGVYVAVPGPNLETRAEYRMLRTLGADVVGMSTIPEAIICAHEGIRASAISVVTDLCDPEDLKKVSVEEILAVAAEAEPRLTRLIVDFLNP
ncbi:MAG: purine-nucleoside phosphorylase [Planctomycetota bacterium]|nr:purine-nucleoside phosphorylase [Planctomycetota bacterium]